MSAQPPWRTYSKTSVFSNEARHDGDRSGHPLRLNSAEPSPQYVVGHKAAEPEERQ